MEIGDEERGAAPVHGGGGPRREAAIHVEDRGTRARRLDHEAVGPVLEDARPGRGIALFRGQRRGVSPVDDDVGSRVEVVTLEDGHVANAWVYFYNAPLGRAERIESGDYLEHLQYGKR